MFSITNHSCRHRWSVDCQWLHSCVLRHIVFFFFIYRVKSRLSLVPSPDKLDRYCHKNTSQFFAECSGDWMIEIQSSLKMNALYTKLILTINSVGRVAFVIWGMANCESIHFIWFDHTALNLLDLKNNFPDSIEMTVISKNRDCVSLLFLIIRRSHTEHIFNIGEKEIVTFSLCYS